MKKLLKIVFVLFMLFSSLVPTVLAEEVSEDIPVPVTDDDTIVEVLNNFYDTVGIPKMNDILDVYKDFVKNYGNLIYQVGYNVYIKTPELLYNYLFGNDDNNIPNSCARFVHTISITQTIPAIVVDYKSKYLYGTVSKPILLNGGTYLDINYYNNLGIDIISLGNYFFLSESDVLKYFPASNGYTKFNYFSDNILSSSTYSFDGVLKGTYDRDNKNKNGFTCAYIVESPIIEDIDLSKDDYLNTVNNNYNTFNFGGNTYYNVYNTYNNDTPQPIAPPDVNPDLSYNYDSFDYCEYQANQVYSIVHDDWSDEDYQSAYDEAYQTCLDSSDHIQSSFEDGALDSVFGILTLPYYLGKGLVDLIVSYDDVPKCVYIPNVSYQGVEMSKDIQFCFDELLNDEKISKFYLLYLNFVDLILYLGLARLFYRKVRSMFSGSDD